MALAALVVYLCAFSLYAHAENLVEDVIDDVVGNVTDAGGEIGKALTDDFTFTTFVLFASNGQTSYNIANASGILTDPFYNASLPTVVYMHGYSENKDSSSVTTIAKAYLQRGSHNFVVVDWSTYAAPPYVTAFLALYGVSKVVGDAVQDIVNAGLPQDNLWLVGHSLGGQMAGLVSRQLDFQPTRISALDPALPGYNVPGFPNLTRDDAVFVDVIHTDAGVFGYNEACGDIDVWPNSGSPLQPGCPELTDVLFCSHHRSWKFFAESVLNATAFPAVLCSSWDDFKDGACPANSTNVVYLGYSANARNLTGSFYLTTNADAPFGRGQGGLLPPAAAAEETVDASTDSKDTTATTGIIRLPKLAHHVEPNA
ncbi:hypothetical protein ONE63_002527 [Megalurothrips usitatus]|uniref:Lipase domain-containing protein n=1 Tax=Megalurothrips usitatus TaxID=439358 RepID=A0AAV7X8E5_9NEOP|nr:hypothetical protein ONE63_002527 [Megalurothrips usitatus]